MNVAESASGVRKRLVFVRAAIERFRPHEVLDIGCGTGEQVTMPLASDYPHISVTGLDSDRTSIEFARRTHNLPNLRYCLDDELATERRFDFVIVSEVLEHVEEPISFLRWVCERLKPGGVALVTVPNGYGPSENAAMVFGLMRWTGAYAPVQLLRRKLQGGGPTVATLVGDTMAVSPHVNFFSYAGIRRVFAATGVRVLEFQPRTFLCGFGFDGLIRRTSLEEWNARVADRLSPWLVSDWMFIVEPSQPPGELKYSRGRISRWRRTLHRWMADHPLG